MKRDSRKWTAAVITSGMIAALLAVLAAAVLVDSPQEAPSGRPLAVVPVRQYDFGLMDPLSSGSYAFVIRNSGSAPLELARGDTTCKCTLSSVSTSRVPPGGQAQVKLQWNAGRKERQYEQSAVVHTNDSSQPDIRFEIRGRIRTQLGAMPESIVIGDVVPGREVTATTVVFSQVWRDLRIVELKSSLGNLSWTSEPLRTAQAEDLDVQGGTVLKMTLPADLPPGHFSHWIRLLVQSADQANGPQPLELTLAGVRLGSLAVYGPAVDSRGVIDFGILRPGEGKELKLLLKIRDKDRQLAVTKVNGEPEFVTAELRPYPGASPDAGLYELRVRIPDDAPHCSYLLEHYGKLRVLFDHPRIENLQLDLRFAVLSHHEV